MSSVSSVRESMSSVSSVKSESMFRKGIKVGIWLAFNKMGAKGKKVKKDKIELSGLDQDEIDLLNDFVGDIVADGEIDDNEKKLLKNWLKPKKKKIKKKPKKQQDSNNNDNTKKTCTKCKERKLLSEFYKDKTSKDGYNSICKACRKKLYGKKK